MIFLDVGAHNGQTLEEVLKPGYGFDRIYAFEPMPVQYANLVATFQKPRLEIFNYGLSDHSGIMPVYGTNEQMEATVFPNKRDADAAISTSCQFSEASIFFQSYVSSPVVMKLNCEGSEIAILNNLIDTGEIWKLTNVMIDFDVRKIPGMEHLESALLQRFKHIGFTNFSLCDTVMKGPTHQARIAHWLKTIGLTP